MLELFQHCPAPARDEVKRPQAQARRAARPRRPSSPNAAQMRFPMHDMPAPMNRRPAYGSHRMWWLPAAVQVEANAADADSPRVLLAPADVARRSKAA